MHEESEHRSSPLRVATLLDLQEENEATTYGNKAANLARLARAGLPVPPTVCLSRALTTDEALDRHTTRSLLDQISAVCSPPWVVRSSGVSEDSDRRAFPGIYRTLLGIQSSKELLSAIDIVGAGADEEVISAYMPPISSRRGIPILVQQVVPAKAAGVVFTKHPINLTATLLINSAWGLGSPVMDGLVTPDEFEVDRDGNIVNSRISKKTWCLGSDQVRVPIEESRRLQPSLTPQDASTLARLALSIEQLFRAPQDIEWVLDPADRLWIVQARRITTVE